MVTRQCRTCGEAKSLSSDSFQWIATAHRFRTICKACDNARRRAYHAANRPRQRAWASRHYARNREKLQADARKRAATNRTERRAYNRQWRAALKVEMHAAYGGKCACCGESEPRFLTLEHARRDGNVHRRRLGGQMQVYCELKRLGWPRDGYELLCWNCQMATSRGDVCPHKRATSAAA
jgi:hypothetical protein